MMVRKGSTCGGGHAMAVGGGVAGLGARGHGRRHAPGGMRETVSAVCGVMGVSVSRECV